MCARVKIFIFKLLNLSQIQELFLEGMGLGLCFFFFFKEINIFLAKLFFKDFIYLLLERGDRREKERERNTNMREKHLSVASPMSPTQDLACSPGMCRNWESNW